MPEADRVRRVMDRLAEARSQLCVGRDNERSRMAALLTAGGPAVVFVHGPAGIGKSVLVDAVVASTQRQVVRLDARRVEPTPTAFLDASAAAIGTGAATPVELGDAMQRLGAPLLVIDGYERLRLIDDWIRDHLVPALPASSATVIVARTPPNAAWRTGEWRHLATELEICPLSDADAAALVEQRLGRSPAAADVLRFGHGHPLALHLAADAVARRSDLALPDGAPPEVVEELVGVFLDELSGPMRTAVQDVSLLRRVTMPILVALCAESMPDEPVDRVWQSLRDLAYVSAGPAGLELDRVVQDVIAADLELRDPHRARRVRQLAGAVAFDEAHRSPGWESTADLLHLVQNPVIRDAFSPPPGQEFVIDSARPSDLEPIVAVLSGTDEQAAAGVVDAWWRSHADAFRVLRGEDAEVRGVAVVAPFDALEPDLIDHDSVLARIRSDLQHRPLRAGQRALVVRRVLTSSAGERPSSEYSALIVDLKRSYLELRPALVRVYAVGRDRALSASVLEQMGFAPVPGDMRIEDDEVGVWSLDFGERSVDEWLARHIAIETTRPSPANAPPADRGGHLVPDGVRDLSAREREVLAVLALGLTNREVAERLFISERTANRHLSNIFVKLGVRNRTEAARVAVAAGLA